MQYFNGILACIITEEIMKFKTLAVLALITYGLSTVSLAQVTLGKKEILLVNERVEMVRLTYPPGSESGMHSHQSPNRTVYFVKGGTLALVPDLGSQSEAKSKVITVNDGDFLYLPATTHNVKNIGATTIIIIENEIK